MHIYKSCLPTPSLCPLFRSVAFFRPTRFPRPFFLPALLTPVTPAQSCSPETVTQTFDSCCNIFSFRYRQLLYSTYMCLYNNWAILLAKITLTALNLGQPEWASNRQLSNKKAQLSLTNPRNAKACQKLLQFDVLTTLSLTILDYLHSFSCFCVRNLRNPAKFTENSSL